MPEHVKYEKEQLAGEVILRLRGNLDGFASDDLACALDDAIDGAEGLLIVDMHGVEFISSAGIGAMMYAFKRLKKKNRSMELIRVQPGVRKVLLMTGVAALLNVSEGSMKINDVLQAEDARNAQAMANIRGILADLFRHLSVPDDQAALKIEEMFRLCTTPTPAADIEGRLRDLLAPLDLAGRLDAALADLPKILHKRIAPYTAGINSLLHVRAGDGRLAETFAEQMNVHLLDTADRNTTALPLTLYDGETIPLENNAHDAALLINVLNRHDDPLPILREIMRVARSRLIIIEAVCFNDTQRRMNMFFDWFHTRIVRGQDGPLARHFDTPRGWKWFLRDQGLRERASVDLGLELPALGEYHWMFVMDLPST
ncbi:MAG: STAS domain-containing protein [Phycisphaerae bacterium]|nr:STAS domain-containing protein [Phycisphaerae bacterium]